MGWCENTDTPRAGASAGARWRGAAGLLLFIPAEDLPVEPSCCFFFFLCLPLRIAPKNRHAGFVSLPKARAVPGIFQVDAAKGLKMGIL